MCRSFGTRAVYIYMKDVACILLIEGDGKAAIMMIIITKLEQFFVSSPYGGKYVGMVQLSVRLLVLQGKKDLPRFFLPRVSYSYPTFFLQSNLPRKRARRARG